MMLTKAQKQQAQEQLNDFQAAHPDIDTFILASIGGLALIATAPITDSLQRITAVSAALLLLGEHALARWRDDDVDEIIVRIRTPEDDSRDVVLRAIGTQALLIIIMIPDPKWGYGLVRDNIGSLLSYLTGLFESADGLAGLL
jgi:predicted regulator of Ras-like GTPase activity (Roadblock/LC7/MglB family)